jgi:hypothetical protein
MDAAEVFLGRLGGGQDVEIADDAGDVEKVPQAPLRLGAFGQPARDLRLDQTAHGDGQRVESACVPEGAFVVEETRAHGTCPRATTTSRGPT